MLLGVNFSCEFSKLIICNLYTIIFTWNCRVNFSFFNLKYFLTAINVENSQWEKESLYMLLGVNFSCEFSKLIICNLYTIIFTWNSRVYFSFLIKIFFNCNQCRTLLKRQTKAEETHYKTFHIKQSKKELSL